ncbi:MAG: lipoprotein bor [Rickettsiales bacterium]|jgi:hypothetical protein|nr:lipoprotein bor [Rickettsiales bacterium]
MIKIYTFSFLLLLSSCTTQKVILDRAGDPELSPAYKQDEAFFLNGPFQSANVDTRRVCGSLDKVYSFQAKKTFLNGFVAMITYGIYTPREGKVFCIDNY